MIPSGWSGTRVTSNSIKAARRNFARAETELSSGAASSAASAARARLQTRQKTPSLVRAQVCGRGTGLWSMRPVLTPQLSQIHFSMS